MRPTIRLKLAAAFLVVVTMAGGAVAPAARDLKRLSDAINTLIGVQVRRVVQADRLNTGQIRLRAAARDHLLDDDPMVREKALAEIAIARVEQREGFDALSALATSEEERSLLATYEDCCGKMKSNNSKVLRVAQARRLLADPEIARMQTARLDIVAKLRAQTAGRMSATVAAAEGAFEGAVRSLVPIIGSAAMIGLAAAFWIILSILRGLGRALDVTADAEGGDGIADMLRSPNRMVVKLRDVVGQVTAAVREVVSGSARIAATSEQLGQGAAEQASATGQASSSVEQMAANIRQSAQNASQTERMALKSASDARASGEAVQEAVSAMQSIAGKITIVQEVARQTDLLTLNAAVEAARAGQHGRGFAVVASKVHKLGERNQTASAEISSLSATTVRVASQAGEMLARLAPEVERTSGPVSEISVTSRELSVGAQQVALAIRQLDKVTQQNSSASEQLATSATELSSQAEQVEGANSFFRKGNPCPGLAEVVPPDRVVRIWARLAPVAGPSAPRRAARGGFVFDLDPENKDDLNAGFHCHDAA